VKRALWGAMFFFVTESVPFTHLLAKSKISEAAMELSIDD